MIFTSELDVMDFILAAAIVFVSISVAVIFYFVIRRMMHRVARATKTQLDDMLVKAVEWPILVAGLIVGTYLGVVSLPFTTGWDTEIRRGFHVGYFVLGGWTVFAILDAVYRWFKLEITSKTRTALDDWIVCLLRIVTPLVVILSVVMLSLELFNIDTTALKTWLNTHGSRIGLILLLTAVSLVGLGIAGSKAIFTVVVRSSAGQADEEVHKRVDTLSKVLITAGQVFIIVIAGLIVLSDFYPNLTPLIAGASVVGVALGFGAQALVKDLISGFFVVMENQYRVGDVVKLADVSGLVTEISLRRTVIRDMDGVVHSIPNGEIKVASNLTKEWSRVNLDITVSYDTDLDRATAVINRVCKRMAEDPVWAPSIIKIPEVLRVEKLGDSGIDLKVVGDTKPTQQWAVTGEIRKRVKKAFDEEGIEMPWPHMKVYFGNAPAAVGPVRKQDETNK
jgi:moderate conductance mechanosensitive channel